MANLSGSTIGGVVGAIVGFWVGNPQLGWMIGSAIGGYVDPDVIEGPRLKDAQGITAMEGMPRPFGYGTFVCGGNIIQSGPLNEFSKKNRGKGGPVQKTWHYHRTYAIRVCEGPIAGIRRIWRNDMLVYSAVAGDMLSAESRKFATRVRMYNGGETQLPDPSLESLPSANGGGVGNVPSYRGTCYIVVTEDDLTDMRGAIPQYRFEVVANGATELVPADIVPSITDNANISHGFDAGLATYESTIDVGRVTRFVAMHGMAGLNNNPSRCRVLVGEQVYFDSGWMAPVSWSSEQMDDWRAALAPEEAEIAKELVGPVASGGAVGVATFPQGTVAAKWQFFGARLESGSATAICDSFYPDPEIAGDYVPIPDVADAMQRVDGSLFYPDWASPPPTVQINIGMASCAEIVTDLLDRVGIPETSIHLADLAQEVRGFMVGRQMEAGAAIRVLQQAYFFDLPEFDGKLRGVNRGGPVVMTIPEDHSIWGDDDEDEAIRGQALEFPRKVSLVAPDPEANYEPTKQTATRRTGDKRAVSEMTAEVPIVLSRDESAQIADKMLKVAWESAQGRRTIQLPDQYGALVASDAISVGSRRWIIEKRDESDGVLTLEITRDRASSYVSAAKGSEGVDPTPPVSSTRGPTAFAIMQVPPLRDGDGVGVYVAGAGIMPGWIGYDLEVSLDNGATYESAMTVTDAATLGRLTTVAGDPMGVKMQSGELDSVTPDQISAGANAIALGGTEVAQFSDADLTAPNEYELSGLVRGLKDTAVVAHPVGSQVVLLDGAVRFLAIDRSFAGKTIYLRPVSLGTAPENNQAYSFVYQPIIVVPPELQQQTPIYTADGAAMTLDDGTIIYGRLT